ncbi:AAHS family 4-hydroxybenzoate transporter-like MFS transporter [Streptacidiphilus sp. MAP12-20]|uniref:MFS transporter n=1 Tax=Streptacidiphilus sp. MAP12-20 TaxID=3156299 RepID=UPI003517EF9C
MTTDVSAMLSPQDFIDQNPMSRRQWRIVVLGLLMMVAEGLDSTVVALVYPKIVKEWGTPLATVTATVALGVLAMVVGGVAVGPLADRYGRKVVAVAGISVFGLGTACMGLAHNIGAFAGLRIAACLGLGAVLPAVLALVADWTPVKRRSQTVTLAFAGVAVGTTVGGILASALIPAYGWPTLMGVCGLAPLLLIPAIVLFVPESVSVLAARRQSVSDVRNALCAVRPDQDLSGVVLDQSAVRRRPRSATRVILSRDFALTTVLLWLCFFVGLGVVFVILSYLPLLVERMGLTTAQAGAAIAVFGGASLVGELAVAFALKRFDRFRVLAALWALGVFGLGAAALWAVQFAALLVAAFVLGLCLPAANAALQAVAAVAYSPSARATGVSWANGMGRLGALASGLFGGMMVQAHWTLATVLLVLTVPVGLGILATLTLHARSRGDRAEPYSGPRPLPAPAPEGSVPSSV